MKIFLIIFLMLDVSLLYAVSRTNKNSELKDNPNLATNVLVGVLEDGKDGRQVLVPKISWTDFFESVDIGPDYDLELKPIKKGISGDYYLFYSQSLQGNKDTITKSDPKLIHPLKNADELIKIFSKGFNEAGKLNPSWKYCHTDSECIKATNNCNKSFSINKSYKKEFNMFMNEKSLKLKCDNIKSANPTLKCINYFCE